MKLKLKKLEEEKKKQEESLKNDVNKLQNKIKELNSEIEDLKNENSKDRTDYLENVKEISRQNDLYKKIIDIMLNNNQFKKICEMSRYLEDDDKWKIQPFSILNNKLNLANVNPSQVETFIEGNISKRELVIDGVINDSSKKVIFQNYDNNDNISPREDDNSEKLNLNLINRSNNKDDDKKINFRLTKDKIALDAGNELKSNGFGDAFSYTDQNSINVFNHSSFTNIVGNTRTITMGLGQDITDGINNTNTVISSFILGVHFGFHPISYMFSFFISFNNTGESILGPSCSSDATQISKNIVLIDNNPTKYLIEVWKYNHKFIDAYFKGNAKNSIYQRESIH